MKIQCKYLFFKEFFSKSLFCTNYNSAVGYILRINMEVDILQEKSTKSHALNNNYKKEVSHLKKTVNQ